MTLSALYGLATGFVLLLNMAAMRSSFARHMDAFGCAAMLAVFWTMGRFFNAFLDPPDSMALYPVIDLIGTIVAYNLWSQRGSIWRLGLTYCFATQCVLHLCFWVAWATDNRWLYEYVLLNNLIFILELGLVGSSGAVHAVHSLGRYLRRRRDAARLADAEG